MSIKYVGKYLKFLTLLLISFCLMTACSSKETINSSKEKKVSTNNSKESTSPVKGGVLSIGFAEEPDTLDVHLTGMSIADTIGGQIGGSLLTLDPKTLEIIPYLAESYQVSEDGKTITFKIKQGITFHDGTPLTSSVYKQTFERILNPNTGATVTRNLLAGVKTITAPDDQTLVIQLEAPSAPFLMNLIAEGYMQPLSMKAIEKYGADYGRNPVGVGPWKFKEWKTGQSISLERNEDFKWSKSFFENRGSAYPDQLVYKFIKDYQTMLAALESGSIDIASNIAAKDVKRYRDNEKFEVLELERQGLGLFIEMNLENEQFKDINLRKALNMAINKDAIIQASLSNEGKPAFGPLPSTIFGYDSEVENYGYQYNKEEALKLLESSGWSKNSKGILEKDGKELKLELLSFDRWNQQAQIVQAMLKEIGIQLSIQTMEAGTLIEKVTQGDYELSFLSYTYYDPDILYMLFHSSQIGGLNHSRVKNPELDALLEKGRATIDTDERKQIYADIQKIVVKDAYWVPLYAEKIFSVANNRVKGIKLSPIGLLPHDIWVK
ncbi:ABC transporter substrate-binding protein [Bacillus sp. CGMCC 1.16607]|uniref:ABC transporter substrate-binding protein n=1 Tax=Bacillus sp. CGMCC 1.16607 TaxID=3351842 RepID=UPI00362E14C9